MNDCSARFIEQLGDALKAKIRLHTVDSFIQTYKTTHPEEVVPSTKTIYRYIKEGLLVIKPIDLPKMVSIRKRSKKNKTPPQKFVGVFVGKFQLKLSLLNHLDFSEKALKLGFQP